jgi:hypothetical protein
MATITLPETELEVSANKKSDVKYVYFFGGGKADKRQDERRAGRQRRWSS